MITDGEELVLKELWNEYCRTMKPHNGRMFLERKDKIIDSFQKATKGNSVYAALNGLKEKGLIIEHKHDDPLTKHWKEQIRLSSKKSENLEEISYRNWIKTMSKKKRLSEADRAMVSEMMKPVKESTWDKRARWIEPTDDGLKLGEILSRINTA